MTVNILDETLDEIRGVRIIQKKKGYRFSAESILLSDFPDLTDVRMAADLGTGSGIIAILLTARSEELDVVGIELQPELYGLAVRNVELAGLSNRIQVVKGDIRTIKDWFKTERLDLVVSNPPYYQVGKARIGPNKERTIARHEMAVSKKDIMDASNLLLKKGGRVAVIYPAERREEVISTMHYSNIGPKRMREISTGEGKLLMAEGEKGYEGALKDEEPLLL